MEMSIPIYRKGKQWYKSMTDVPVDKDTEGNIIGNPNFGKYDERVYVECYGFVVPIDLTLDQLVDLHLNHRWGKTGGLGLRGPHYKFDQHVPCLGHEQEVADRAALEGFEVIA